MPVTAASQRHNVVRLNNSYYVVVTAKPVVARSVHPPDVMSTIGRSSLVSYHTHKLVVTGVEPLTVGTIQFLIVNFDLVLFESKFSCDASQLWFFFF